MFNRLQSQEYTNEGYECLKFWYFIYGPAGTTGKLSVAKQNTSLTFEQHLWSNNIYVYAWRYGQVLINDGSSSFSALFQAFKSSPDVIIGIDDLLFTLGICPPPVNCDFEDNNICSWTRAKNDKFNWLLHSGATESPNTGPLVGKNRI